MLVLTARPGKKFTITGDCTITVLGNNRYGFEGPGKVVRTEIERDPEVDPNADTQLYQEGGPTL